MARCFGHAETAREHLDMSWLDWWRLDLIDVVVMGIVVILLMIFGGK